MLKDRHSKRAGRVAAWMLALGWFAAADVRAATVAEASAASAASTLRVLRLPELAEQLQLPAILNLPVGTADDVLSLESAQRAARNHSLEVEAAVWRVDSFGHARQVARGGLLPHMDVRIAAGRGRLDSVDPALNLPRRETTATLRQALVDEPARREWRRQGVLVDSAERQLEGAVSQASLEGGLAFLAALQARIGMALGDDHEKLLIELLRYVGERATAGGASQADRERVKARVANLRSGLSDARSVLQSSLRNVERLIGHQPGALALAAEVSVPVPSRLETAVEMARAGNAELRAAEAEMEAARAETGVAQARFLPRLELELSHVRSENIAGSVASNRDSRALVILNIPLLNGGADLAQINASKARREELWARARHVERKLTQELGVTYGNLDATTERYAAVREELEANSRVVRAFREQLLGSNRSLLDVLDAYQRLYQSRLDLTQLLIAEAQNHLRIAHLTGSLIPQPSTR